MADRSDDEPEIEADRVDPRADLVTFTGSVRVGKYIAEKAGYKRIVLELGGVTISLSGLAVGSLVGIVLNAILPGNDFEFDTSELEESAE